MEKRNRTLLWLLSAYCNRKMNERDIYLGNVVGVYYSIRWKNFPFQWRMAAIGYCKAGKVFSFSLRILSVCHASVSLWPRNRSWPQSKTTWKSESGRRNLVQIQLKQNEAFLGEVFNQGDKFMYGLLLACPKDKDRQAFIFMAEYFVVSTLNKDGGKCLTLIIKSLSKFLNLSS